MSRRRSIRKFTPEPVPEASVEALLDAGLLAPSGRNARPVEFFVVRDKATIERLADCREGHSGAALKTASLAIVVTARPEKSDIWAVDASIAATHILLQAEVLHLGCCWVQVMTRRCGPEMTEGAVRKILNIPADLSILCMIAVGQPDEAKEPHVLEGLDRSKVHYL
ncbi:MAG: nitroreductase family protein [Fretibacterium sp.]|nr:nitroreductase family protein [Fretibacterium sp.]